MTDHLDHPFGTSPTIIRCRWREDYHRPIECETTVRLEEGSYLYGVVANQSISRAAGQSPLLYIGKGNRARVMSLHVGGHSALQALARLRHAGGADSPSVAIYAKRCDSDDRASLEEAKALTSYARTHGELPPCNLKWEGYILGRLLRFLAVKGSPPEARLLTYDWPPHAPAATWVDVSSGRPRSWSWSLGWSWGSGPWPAPEGMDQTLSGCLMAVAPASNDTKDLAAVFDPAPNVGVVAQQRCERIADAETTDDVLENVFRIASGWEAGKFEPKELVKRVAEGMSTR